MRTQAITLLFMVLLTQTVAATTVNVSVIGRGFEVGEIMKLHLEINPSEEVGGNFNIFRVESDRRVLVKQPFRKPTPGSCYGCMKDVPLRSYFSEDFYLIPKEQGLYMAEARFGGVVDHANFTVGSVETTSSVIESTTSTTLMAETPTTLTQNTSTTSSIESTAQAVVESTVTTSLKIQTPMLLEDQEKGFLAKAVELLRRVFQNIVGWLH